MRGPDDAGTFAAATTSDRQSLARPVVRWRLFDGCVRNDVMSKDLTSQREPFASKGPPSVVPWKMPGPATKGCPFSTRSSSAKVWPSETTKSRLALPEPG